jgi:cytochrome c553
MRRLMSARAHRISAVIAATIAGMTIGGFLFAWSGIYNIAASRGHWAAVEWFLEFGMKNSVKRRAFAIEEPPLASSDLAALGAAHFHRACLHCHGAPGVPGDLSAQQALPPPPELAHAASEWRPRELFWIVKHGIKYTGMPAWVAQERDDEVWAVVAFLKRLPELDAEGYRRLAGVAGTAAQSGRDIATLGRSSELIGACARCHGDEQRRPVSGLVPVLHVQPAEFLTAALTAYAKGLRQSGIMQPVARELGADEIDKLAAYYAGLAVPKQASRTGSAAEARALAADGDPDAKIPACGTCHELGALPVYPRLAGQNAAYMANRLWLWKNGLAASAGTEAIMAPIARLLSDGQIAELAAYFESLPPERQRGRTP